jgi:hypothetical protein
MVFVVEITMETELGIAAEIPMNLRSGAGMGIYSLFHTASTEVMK